MKKLLLVLYIVPFVHTILSTIIIYAGAVNKIDMDVSFGGLIVTGIIAFICLSILLIEQTKDEMEKNLTKNENIAIQKVSGCLHNFQVWSPIDTVETCIKCGKSQKC